jgi:hypothetical protein
LAWAATPPSTPSAAGQTCLTTVSLVKLV